MEIRFDFRTHSADGILINCHDQRRGDYLSLELVNGTVSLNVLMLMPT